MLRHPQLINAMKLHNPAQIKDEIAKLNREESQLQQEFTKRVQDHQQFIENTKARYNQIQGAKAAYQQTLDAMKNGEVKKKDKA